MTVMLLENTPAVLSLEKLCEDHGYTYHWSSGQKPHLTKMCKRIDCRKSNYVPFVVLGLSTSSSTTPTPTSSPSLSQDFVFGREQTHRNPVSERSGSTSEELWRNPLQKPTETENKNTNKGREEVQSDLLHDLPDWLQEFRENLVDESSLLEPRVDLAPEDQDTSRSSHESPMESRAKVEPGSGKQCIYALSEAPKLRHIKSCTIRRTGFIHEFLYLIKLSYTFIAGNCDRH